jgi:hypothetical protein
VGRHGRRARARDRLARQGLDPAIAKETGAKAAHPNARFTVAAINNLALDDAWDDPKGVAIDVIFGGRRRPPCRSDGACTPVEGVYMAATMGSKPGRSRRSARRCVAIHSRCSFAGYNMSDYFQHWLDLGKKLEAGRPTPKIYTTNWFRKGEDGKRLMATAEHARPQVDDRSHRGQDIGTEHFGVSPRHEDLNWTGLDQRRTVQHGHQHRQGCGQAELKLHAELFQQLAHHLPKELPATKAASSSAWWLELPWCFAHFVSLRIPCRGNTGDRLSRIRGVSPTKAPRAGLFVWPRAAAEGSVVPAEIHAAHRFVQGRRADVGGTFGDHLERLPWCWRVPRLLPLPGGWDRLQIAQDARVVR